MLRVYADDYIGIGSVMERIQASARSTTEQINEASRTWVANQLELLKQRTLMVHLDVSSELIDILVPQLKARAMSGIEVNLELANLMRTINIELKKRLFLYMPPEEAAYYYIVPRLKVDVSVRDNFLSVHADVRDAYNCIAFGLYTAAVFHSMRIVEKGLKALADSISVPFTYEQWQTVIEQIESKIKDLKNLPKGQQKTEDQQFYSEAAKEFSYFKDAWRNHVMHGRATYDKPDAERILEHVRYFMKHLATRLKE